MRQDVLCFQPHGIVHMSFLRVLVLPQQNLGLFHLVHTTESINQHVFYYLEHS